jgi:hypothetical protein
MNVGEADMNNTLRSHIRRRLRQLSLAVCALGATLVLSLPQAQAATIDEPTLIKIASGYEAMSRHRKAPSVTPPLAGEKFNYAPNVPKSGFQ